MPSSENVVSPQAPPQNFVELAITSTCRPRRLRCAKSQRGAVIFHRELLPNNELALVSTGGNGPPEPFRCGGVDECDTDCNRVAVHAEERAIIRAERTMLHGAELVHVEVVDGDLVASGTPSCWQCSRMVLEAGMRGVWLFHADGWRFYEAETFHRLTLAHNCMPDRSD